FVAVAHAQDGANGFSPFGIRHADHGCFKNAWVIHQARLDLGRVDVLTARDDHVLAAPGNGKVAILVHAPQVPCAQPAIAHHTLGLFFAIPIALHDIGPTGFDFANDVGRDGYAILIDDAHIAEKRRQPRAHLLFHGSI